MKLVKKYAEAQSLTSEMMEGAFRSINDTLDTDSQVDPVRQSVRYAFLLGHDYYSSTVKSLENGYIFSAMATVRISLEITVDLLYIHDYQKGEGRQAEYAKKYVDSIEKYRVEFIKQTGNLAGKKTLDTELLKRLNSWTTRTIEQRIALIGPGMATMYNMMSYGTHADPSLLLYKYIPGYTEVQKRIIATLNLLNAKTLLEFIDTYETGFKINPDSFAKLSALLGE